MSTMELKPCSFLMLFGLWCDLFNITAGALLCINLDIFATIGASTIIINLVSILYMVLHKKLGFQYHQKISRLLIIYPQLCHLVFAFWCYGTLIKEEKIKEADIYLEVPIIGLFVGFIWSLMSVVQMLFSEYCVCFCSKKTVKELKELKEQKKAKKQRNQDHAHVNMEDLEAKNYDFEEGKLDFVTDDLYEEKFNFELERPDVEEGKLYPKLDNGEGNINPSAPPM